MNEVTKHTPGSWEVFPSPRVAEKGQRFGVQSKRGPIVADCGLVENDYSLANSRLIAAAPDMLAICKRILDHPLIRITGDVEAPLRAAIAKAETPGTSRD